jgi:hypothetical protein
MSFEVRATFPFDDDWYETSERLDDIAGHPASFAGSGACRDMRGGREMGWYEETFGAAQSLKGRLELMGVDGLVIVIRER